jgi:adenylylsulfate kinase-like enzyme
VKARANEIKEFTGVSAPYEAPQRAEVELHTDKSTVAECVTRIVDYLQLTAEGSDVSI